MKALLLVIVCAALCVTVVSCNGQADNGQVVPEDRPPGVLIINYAADFADTFPAPTLDSVLALEWLQMQANARGIDVRTRSYPFGDLVIQIGPRRSGNEGDWLYEINGQMAMEAVSKQRVSHTDTLVFSFK